MEATATTTARDKRTGQFAPSVERPCRCGHPLGAHTAARVAGEQPCLECECESFKKGAK